MADAKRRPTMYDVARECGVSQATVSLVLNGVAGVRVAEQTRQRVIETAERLHYRRSSRVRADARGPTAIGLIIDELMASPFAAPIMEGAREAAWEHQCVVDVISTRNHGPIEQAATASLLSRPIAGIIYATLFTREVAPPPIPADTPVVLLNCYDAEQSFTSIVPDDRAAARALTKSMINAGHRRIAHIAGESFLDAGRDRAAGYRDAIEEAGIPFDPELVTTLGSAVEDAYDCTGALLDLPDPPTAIFCFNDRMALAVHEAARDRGLHVPHDLSIAGFDNDPFVTAFLPSLTTAVLPHEAMARWAVERIFDMRHGRLGSPPEQHRLKCQLMRRKSLAKPRTPVGKRVEAKLGFS
jgi:LacI family transcriptional regulator